MSRGDEDGVYGATRATLPDPREHDAARATRRPRAVLTPSVFAYLDYRTFLNDWFNARKRADPTYSLAVFARDGGCSKATLANVLGGARTPRPDSLDAFARAMDLPTHERAYLGLLVELASAPDIPRRREVMERVLASDRYRQVHLADRGPEADLARYLEHWYLAAIREMVSLVGFREDPTWIAENLVPPITPHEASAGLATLQELGYVARNASGALVQRELQVRTDPDSAHRAVERFHREVVPQMLSTIDGTKGREQHLLGLTLSLDADQLQEVKTRLNALIVQLSALGDEGTGRPGRRVYQLALQVLPLSLDPSVSS